MPHEAVKRQWYNHEEILNMSMPELRAAFDKTMLHMSDMQRKFVTGFLNGLSEQKAATQAGYSTRTRNRSWSLKRAKKVQQAIALGQEIAQRGAGTTPEWVRQELKSVYEEARANDDLPAATKALQELCRIDGHYAEQQLKLMHSAHDGGPLDKEVSEQEWEMLSKLYHDIRDKDEAEALH